MKIKTIARSEEDFTRERPRDTLKVHRNLDPALHPFERAREYTRAVNAVKLNKVFAKPFVHAFDGHKDGISAIAINKKSLKSFVSGAHDGEIRVWDISERRTVCQHRGAHTGAVRGIAVHPNGQSFVSCGTDQTIKVWRLGGLDEGTMGGQEPDNSNALVQTMMGEDCYSMVDHSWDGDLFATASGTCVQTWTPERKHPVATFKWGETSVHAVRFNPIESDLFASAASDRSVCLYDLRAQSPIRKVVLTMMSNAIAWNPQEAFNFTVANEDHNLYTFDMRNLKSAICVHHDFVSAVIDVDYSPTGREFVAGGYDRTVRIFPSTAGHSREVYHTKRMQRLSATKFTSDSKFVLSGSEDMQVRLWKAEAGQSLKTMLPRERKKRDYNTKLLQRFEQLPEVKRIARHRHLPKSIVKAKHKKQVMDQADHRKEQNRKRHGQSTPDEPERTRHIIRNEN
eukprot:TRINITY_DN3241_c0_g1_i5.p1 TRINITY_DN3241_c0_g1~~TRINITY_DN3241_c0_g1_i5.p1  ORF type:complete len:454 (+),score=97.97 TRINITY_DN3241_c0_g1_i5:197-1558(+)